MTILYKIKQGLKYLANLDFPHKNLLFWAFSALVVIFSVYQLYFDVFITDNIFGQDKVGFKGLFEVATNHSVDNPLAKFIHKHFISLWTATALFAMSIRLFVFFDGFFKTKRLHGDSLFVNHLFGFFGASILSTISRVVIFAFLGLVAVKSGYALSHSNHIITGIKEGLESYIFRFVPTFFNIQNYYLALLITILSIGLPGYFIHRLCHVSRFFWLTVHRPHHMPNILYPLAITPGNVLEFLIMVPMTLFSAIVSKIIYTEPLFLEVSLWIITGYGLEVFNHSGVHYELAYKNWFIRNMSRLYGDKGVYHILHHSSLPNDTLVNLSEGPFQIWDRLFGTYRKPGPEMPPIGLTNSKPIKLNPLRILFSGFLQLGYELWFNKSVKARFLVLFGSSNYNPPISKDFLFQTNKEEQPPGVISEDPKFQEDEMEASEVTDNEGINSGQLPPNWAA